MQELEAKLQGQMQRHLGCHTLLEPPTPDVGLMGQVEARVATAEATLPQSQTSTVPGAPMQGEATTNQTAPPRTTESELERDSQGRPKQTGIQKQRLCCSMYLLGAPTRIC